jgi:hypothetical protein
MNGTTLSRTAVLFAVLCHAAPLGAQRTESRTAWDFTLATSGTVSSASASWVGFTAPVVADRIRFGLGLRATAVGGDLALTPRGATRVPVGVIDTLYLSSAALMVNVSGHAEARLTDRLAAGLNIDLVGFGAGGDRDARYHAGAGIADQSVRAKPTGSNIFLYGSKDRGSLNSEFYARWRLNERVAVRGGLSHQLVEYEAARTLASNTAFFRQYRNLAVVGVRIQR